MPSVSSSAPLAKSGEWVSDAVIRQSHHTRLEGSVAADVAGTLHIEQGAKNAAGEIEWDIDSEYEITGNDGKGFLEQLVSSWWRIRYANAAGAVQKSFRVQAVAMPGDS